MNWNSKDHVDPAEAFVTGAGAGDYAHINSVKYLPASGNILASFRNLSQVMRIATTARDGFQPGDVIWKLGGKLNQFTFNDDPLYYGNCAQHTARLLPNGHLMLFDNGSRLEATGPISSQSADMCANPADPTGPRIARPQTRVTEYALDEQNHTATLVWEFVPPDHRYAAFAGSQQRLPDGDTFIGWSQAQRRDGRWRRAAGGQPGDDRGRRGLEAVGSGWFSYRAHLGSSPDALDPAATVHLTPGRRELHRGQAGRGRLRL